LRCGYIVRPSPGSCADPFEDNYEPENELDELSINHSISYKEINQPNI
jgi:hypothetical protein